MKTVEIVIGANYGDEGKGTTVNTILQSYNETGTSYEKSIVVRFNGGHQAGHKSHLTEDKYHIASLYGSGTILGVDTYLSSYCLISLSHWLNELKALEANGIRVPKIHVDPFAIITTPFDVIYNHIDSTNRSHGTVGRGIGKTMVRHFKDNLKIYFMDLINPKVIKLKWKEVFDYYCAKLSSDITKEEFWNRCLPYLEDEKEMINRMHSHEELYTMQRFKWIVNKHDLIVFEGAQGTLLDMDHGLYFPNVTYSNTTTKNVTELLKSVTDFSRVVNFNLVTRSYLTRHGNGWFPEEYDFSKDNPSFRKYDFGNNPNDYQGSMRTALLDLNLLKYSKQINLQYLPSSGLVQRLWVNCLDEFNSDLDFQSLGMNVIKRNSPICKPLDIFDGFIR